MNTSKLLSLITSSMLAGGATPLQEEKLGAWVDKHVPALLQDANAVLHNFGWSAVTTLVDEAVRAAQDLKDRFVGMDRAKIARTTVRYVVDLVLPEPARRWVAPLLTDEVLAGLIEAAYRRLFGAGPAPVLDDPSVKPGGLE